MIGSVAPLILMKSNTAYADYTRQIELTSITYGRNIAYSDYFIIPSDCNGDVTITINGSYTSAELQRSGGLRVSTVTGERQTIPNYPQNPYRIAISKSDMVSGDIQNITVDYYINGSDPDLGVKSQEQRYNTTTFYSADFTQSTSLPLIYTGSLFLSDFTPNGNCNSIQVDASTVGGDRLEWRLNLGQSGIDGQTAWLPIGFKMPIQVGQFEEHSIQLRMEDPDNPGQYYNLQPSELSLCSVTYGYMSDVYMSLQPGEYQELPTQEMPTMPNYELPTMPNVAEYVQAPVSVLSTVFSWLTNLPHIAVLIGVLAFAFIVKVIIW